MRKNGTFRLPEHLGHEICPEEPPIRVGFASKCEQTTPPNPSARLSPPDPEKLHGFTNKNSPPTPKARVEVGFSLSC